MGRADEHFGIRALLALKTDLEKLRLVDQCTGAGAKCIGSFLEVTQLLGGSFFHGLSTRISVDIQKSLGNATHLLFEIIAD